MPRWTAWVAIYVFAVLTPWAKAQVTIEPAGPDGSPDYILGPGDQLRIHAVHVEELQDGTITIGLDGMISLPLVGRIKVGGLTAAQAETELNVRYKDYLVRPDISVSVVEYQSQPVSVLGAVKNPGIQQVRGSRSVIEMVSLAGGLTDNAGSRLKITRRLDSGTLPLPGATKDSSGKYMTAEISVRSLMEARRPEENILVKANDVITIPPSGNVYVIGHVLKAGPLMFDQQDRMTVLQAVSAAGGMDNLAQPKSARIMRRVPGRQERVEIAVNLKGVMEGKAPDMPMEVEDILFVPNNTSKAVALKALDVGIAMATGIVIWGRF